MDMVQSGPPSAGAVTSMSATSPTNEPKCPMKTTDPVNANRPASAVGCGLRSGSSGKWNEAPLPPTASSCTMRPPGAPITYISRLALISQSR
jgi:hypothetical protein